MDGGNILGEEISVFTLHFTVQALELSLENFETVEILDSLLQRRHNVLNARAALTARGVSIQARA